MLVEMRCIVNNYSIAWFQTVEDTKHLKQCRKWNLK
jgi:hypothetical protein